jgi:hypothetical protein
MNQVEVFPVVLQMAVYAILAVGIAQLQMRVIAVLLGKCFRNFFVARRTLRRSVQRAVRF